MKRDYLFHTILFSFLPETSQEIKQEIISRFSTLGEDCGGKKEGILFFSAKENLDTRKNIHLVEIAIFDSESSFKKFKEHQKHKEIVEILKNSTDWYVGDIWGEFPQM